MLEGELFAFLERTADAAFAVTDEGEICFWNRAAERLFGHSPAQVLHHSCFEVLHGQGALGTTVCVGNCTVQQLAARGKEIPDFDMAVKRRSGENLWVNVSTLLFEEPRRGRRLVVHLARDISQRKKTEQVLSKLQGVSKEIMEISQQEAGRPAPVLTLSEQELRILRLFAQARSSAEIARELGITPPTLRNHLHSINEKLRTHNRLEAVMHALRRGLI